MELDRALANCVDSVLTGPLVETPGAVLGRALPLFERRRLPDIKALIKIMQIGAPYQVGGDHREILQISLGSRA